MSTLVSLTAGMPPKRNRAEVEQEQRESNEERTEHHRNIRRRLDGVLRFREMGNRERSELVRGIADITRAGFPQPDNIVTIMQLLNGYLGIYGVAAYNAASYTGSLGPNPTALQILQAADVGDVPPSLVEDAGGPITSRPMVTLWSDQRTIVGLHVYAMFAPAPHQGHPVFILINLRGTQGGAWRGEQQGGMVRQLGLAALRILGVPDDAAIGGRTQTLIYQRAAQEIYNDIRPTITQLGTALISSGYRPMLMFAGYSAGASLASALARNFPAHSVAGVFEYSGVEALTPGELTAPGYYRTQHMQDPLVVMNRFTMGGASWGAAFASGLRTLLSGTATHAADQPAINAANTIPPAAVSLAQAMGFQPPVMRNQATIPEGFRPASRELMQGAGARVMQIANSVTQSSVWQRGYATAAQMVRMGRNAPSDLRAMVSNNPAMADLSRAIVQRAPGDLVAQTQHVVNGFRAAVPAINGTTITVPLASALASIALQQGDSTRAATVALGAIVAVGIQRGVDTAYDASNPALPPDDAAMMNNNAEGTQLSAAVGDPQPNALPQVIGGTGAVVAVIAPPGGALGIPAPAAPVPTMPPAGQLALPAPPSN